MHKTKEIKNRKAKFEYEFMQGYEAGLMLKGTEVKSLRAGEANLNDAYCLFDKSGELYLKSSYIAEYEFGNINNHETRRDRKLLLRKPELNKLLRKSTEKGLLIVPYRFYFSERGIAKIEIFLAQSKKAFDKRNTIKDRDSKRDLDRIRKENS